jgi:hypothetical protein
MEVAVARQMAVVNSVKSSVFSKWQRDGASAESSLLTPGPFLRLAVD